MVYLFFGYPGIDISMDTYKKKTSIETTGLMGPRLTLAAQEIYGYNKA